MGSLAAGAAALTCERLGLAPAQAAEAEPPRGAIIPALESLVKKAGLEGDVSLRPLRIAPQDMPWSLSLGEVRKGEQITFLLSGRWYVSRAADLWFEPGLVFHARVLMDKPYNPMHNSGTWQADETGELKVARSASEFHSSAGNLATPPEAYRAAEGWIEGVALVWKGEAAEGLARLNATGDYTGLIAGERARLADPVNLPRLWQSYFQLQNGPGIFRSREEGVIECLTERNVSIIQHPVLHVLEPGARFDWKWLVEQLPAKVGENSLPTHDYLSVAVEFDDGQDLTYFWSADLPAGQTFKCPLPGWDKRETHHVVRSGHAGLGQWQSESQDIYAHYQQHIGGSARMIVGVWLIAVSCFGRGRGKARFAGLTLSGKGWQRQIL